MRKIIFTAIAIIFSHNTYSQIEIIKTVNEEEGVGSFRMVSNRNNAGALFYTVRAFFENNEHNKSRVFLYNESGNLFKTVTINKKRVAIRDVSTTKFNSDEKAEILYTYENGLEIIDEDSNILFSTTGDESINYDGSQILFDNQNNYFAAGGTPIILFKNSKNLSLSTQAIQLSKQSSIYPIPSNHIINIKNPFDNNDVYVDLFIYNSAGEIVINDDFFFEGTKKQIDISKLSTGVYHAIIKGDDKIFTQKIIKD